MWPQQRTVCDDVAIPLVVLLATDLLYFNPIQHCWRQQQRNFKRSDGCVTPTSYQSPSAWFFVFTLILFWRTLCHICVIHNTLHSTLSNNMTNNYAFFLWYCVGAHNVVNGAPMASYRLNTHRCGTRIILWLSTPPPVRSSERWTSPNCWNRRNDTGERTVSTVLHSTRRRAMSSTWRASGGVTCSNFDGSGSRWSRPISLQKAVSTIHSVLWSHKAVCQGRLNCGSSDFTQLNQLNTLLEKHNAHKCWDFGCPTWRKQHANAALYDMRSIWGMGVS